MVRHPSKLDIRERHHFVFDTTFELRERYRALIPGGRSNKLMNQVLKSIVALAETSEGQHILLAVELGMLDLADALSAHAHRKEIKKMRFIRMQNIANVVIEEYEYQGCMIVFVDGQQVLDKTFEELVQAAKPKEAADASNTK